MCDAAADFLGASFFSWAASVRAAATTTSSDSVLRLKSSSTFSTEDYHRRPCWAGLSRCPNVFCSSTMELIAGPPFDETRLIGGIEPEEIAELGRLLDRREIPVGVELVG